MFPIFSSSDGSLAIVDRYHLRPANWFHLGAIYLTGHVTGESYVEKRYAVLEKLSASTYM